MTESTIKFVFQGATGGLLSEIKRLNAELKQTQSATKASNQETKAQANTFKELGSAIAAAGIAASVTSIGNEVLGIGLKFEALKSTLENTLGSKSGAEQVFGRLQKFAADTPNQLDEVVQAFISLKQRGIEPTNDVLRSFGDIAASQGKPLQQFIEAVLDATTGENERLKEFGIQAQAAGNKVSFTFQGLTKTVNKTPEAIRGALQSFGQLDGVLGGMEKKAATLGGQFSNLTDNTEALQNEMFGLVQGPLIALVTEANTLINTFRELPAPIQKTILGIAGLGGVLAATVAAIAAFNLVNGQAVVTATAESAALVRNAIATNAVAAAKFLAAAATGKLTEAQIVSGSAMAATAISAGLVVGALASIALAVDTFAKTTEAARALEKDTANLEKSFASLTEVESKYADAAKKKAISQGLEADALKRTKEQLGPVQNALDVLRGLLNTLSLRNLLTEFAKLDVIPEPLKNLINALANVLPKVSTAAEESLREQAVAFEDQATKADEITGKVFSLFSGGAKKLSDQELKLYKSAVDEATVAIEAHIPIDAQDKALKESKLPLLARSKKLIDEETTAREKNKIATEAGADVATLEQKNNALALQQALKLALVKNYQAEGVLSAKDSQAEITRIEKAGLEKRLENSLAAIAQNAKLTSEAKTFAIQKPLLDEGIKLQTEAATIEGQIADKSREGKKQILDKQLNDLEQFQAQANDAIAASETAQLTKFEQLYQKDLSKKQEFELLKLAVAQDRVNAEIEAEQERAKVLESLKFTDLDEIEANEAKIRASKQKTAQLTLKALENQRSLEQAVTELRLKGLRDAADQQKNASEARSDQLTNELKQIELITGSLDRQDKLRKAQIDLSNAQTALATTGGQIELDNLTRALDIRKKLSDAQTSPEVKAVLAKQLEILTGKPNTSEADIAARKIQTENQLQQIKRQGLVLEQAIARQNLEIDLQRNKLASERLVIESKNAALSAQQSLNDAQNKLDQLRTDPSSDPQAIKNAEAQVQRASQTVNQANQNVGASEANAAQQGQLETLARQTLDAQQLAAKAQFQAADGARLQAAQLTLVEAKARNIAEILRQSTPVDQLNRRTNQLAAQFDRQAQPFALPGATIAPVSNIIRVSPATVQVNQAAQPDQLAPLRDLVNLQRESNAHLRAIASRRPIEKIENNTTVVQNPVVRSNGGLPR